MRIRTHAELARGLLAGAWLQNRGRVTLTVLAIALGVALASAVHTINYSAAREFSSAVRSLAGASDLVVRGPRSGFDELIYPQLASRPEVAVASPVLELDAQLVRPRATLRVLGIDPLRALELKPGLLGEAQDKLVDLLAPGSVMLSLPAAQSLGAAAGDVIVAQSGQAAIELRVLAVLPLNDALRQPLALMDIAAAQWAFERLGTISRIDLRLRNAADIDRTREALRSVLPPGVAIMEAELAAEQALALSRAYRVNLNVLALVALFTGAVLVYSTQSLALLRRRTHLALLRALGLPASRLTVLVAAEALALGTAGSVLGLALGIGASYLALVNLGGDLGAGYFAGLVARPRIDIYGLALIACCGLAAALLGALAPAWEAARTPPSPALRSGSEQALRRTLSPFAGGVVLLLAAALAYARPIAGLPLFGYAAIACILIAALLLLPHYTRSALHAVPLPAGSTPRLALLYLRAAPRFTSISLAAVVASVSLTVAMLVMIASFRSSLDNWLHAVLPADLYARAGSAQSAWIDERTQARMRTASAVARVAFSRYDAVLLDPARPPVSLIARDIDPERPEAIQWVSPQQLPKDDTTPIWVSEAARALFALEIGQRVDIPIAGQRLRATVAGVWRDYVRQNGAILVPRAEYVRVSGDTRANEAWIWLRPGLDPESGAARLREALQLGPEIELREPRLLRQMSLATFDRTFAVTYALELVAVLIGLFGISVGASAGALARRRELGILHHLGLSRAALRSLLAFEGGVTGALGAIAGAAAGLLMSVVLVHVVNRQSFHWSMSIDVPWGLIGALIAVLALTATATAYASVRGALGDDIVRAVKEDW